MTYITGCLKWERAFIFIQHYKKTTTTKTQKQYIYNYFEIAIIYYSLLMTISSSLPGQLSPPDSEPAAASCTNQRSAESKRDGQRKEMERKKRGFT